MASQPGKGVMEGKSVFGHLIPKRTKTISECSENSDMGAGNLTEGVPELDVESTDLVPNRLNATQLIGPPSPPHSGPYPMPEGKEHYLYDKYLAKFFNPLHTKDTPYTDNTPSSERLRGVLYDVDGKFAYTTYSDEMRSYHPMLDIRTLTKDLK